MKRSAFVLAITAGVMAAAYGAAAAMNVTDSTAATGSNVVAKCSDVTGTTFVLEGLLLHNPDTSVFVDGTPTDITKFTSVNLEFLDAGCSGFGIHAYVQVEKTGGVVIFSGSCLPHTGGGLGPNLPVISDNRDGCTVTAAAASVADAIKLVVTTS